jgi:two-component system NarL family response regulator
MNPPPGPLRTRILVVEDHPATVLGLITHLQAEPDFEVVGHTDSWREALQLVRTLRPDLMILDLWLRDGHGWSVLQELRCTKELPKTLVYSVLDEASHATRLLREGAHGYLPKNSTLDDVVAALRRIRAGQIAISDLMATQIIAQTVRSRAHPGLESNGDAPQALDGLSDRELQVLDLIAAGLRNKEIGVRLGLSAGTVGTYKSRLMKKMGVGSLSEMLRLALMPVAGQHRTATGAPE